MLGATLVAVEKGRIKHFRKIWASCFEIDGIGFGFGNTFCCLRYKPSRKQVLRGILQSISVYMPNKNQRVWQATSAERCVPIGFKTGNYKTMMLVLHGVAASRDRNRTCLQALEKLTHIMPREYNLQPPDLSSKGTVFRSSGVTC